MTIFLGPFFPGPFSRDDCSRVSFWKRGTHLVGGLVHWEAWEYDCSATGLTPVLRVGRCRDHWRLSSLAIHLQPTRCWEACSCTATAAAAATAAAHHPLIILCWPRWRRRFQRSCWHSRCYPSAVTGALRIRRALRCYEDRRCRRADDPPRPLTSTDTISLWPTSSVFCNKIWKKNCFTNYLSEGYSWDLSNY